MIRADVSWHMPAGAMLHCNFQTVGQVSPGGLYYQVPTMDSMAGHTLSETSMGKYRQYWRRATQLPFTPHSSPPPCKNAPDIF